MERTNYEVEPSFVPPLSLLEHGVASVVSVARHLLLSLVYFIIYLHYSFLVACSSNIIKKIYIINLDDVIYLIIIEKKYIISSSI